MTVGEWLRARAPQPPPRLTARLEAMLGADLDASMDRAPELLLRSGERLVSELLASNSTTRESALDLLAADAFVTYAFEAASEGPLAIEARAEAAMVRIASIAVAGDHAE